MYLDGIVQGAGSGITPTDPTKSTNNVQNKHPSNETFIGYDLGLARLKRGIGEMAHLDKAKTDMGSDLHGMMLLFSTANLKDQE